MLKCTPAFAALRKQTLGMGAYGFDDRKHSSAFPATGVKMDQRILHFLNDESGATAIEYGLIAAIVGVGIILGLQNVRTELQATLTKISTELKNASN